MNRVFKTRHFGRWVRKVGLSDRALCQAVEEMIRGLIDADLGGGVVKKRIGLAGRGKRGGARTLIATNKGDRWFFVFGFEKNERANISSEELGALQDVAADLLARTASQLGEATEDGSLQEIIVQHSLLPVTRMARGVTDGGATLREIGARRCKVSQMGRT